jgi:adenosine 3'-phospho 5'-phosphosulfate transporter B2
MAGLKYAAAASPTVGGSESRRLVHRVHHHARLVGLFLAITGCFLVYSLIQERLMTLGFGPAKERFRHSLFIILVNRLVCCAVAAAALSLAGKSLQPGAPLALFSIPSLANVLGSASQYEALKYVSFPLQALAKCAKTVSEQLACWA